MKVSVIDRRVFSWNNRQAAPIIVIACKGMRLPRLTYLCSQMNSLMKYGLYVLALTSLLWSCGQSNQDSQDAAAEAAVDSLHFGEMITPDGAITMDELLVRLADSDSVATKVRGLVTSVCQVKGCWMTVKSPAAEDAPEVFVQFKDYEFFMPFGLAGTEVVMDGYAYRDVTSVEELRHYAEDEGKTAEEIAAITEPMEELKFLASGVVIVQ